ncbi:Lipopolysaccharide core heptose(I) kinase RfaP [Phycisphaerae bacterium RAS1]|nr:Lipopolysaccharide core heptose(I) kinase RfaP [Phycisphaerae bacterium RAS1]
MTRRSEVSSAGRERLDEAGLAGGRELIDAALSDARTAGEWECLSKPGLGSRQRWRWRAAQATARPGLYLKRYLGAPLAAQWDRLVRQSPLRSRAWWEYAQCSGLLEAHIAAPRPLAVSEEMVGPFERRSAVALEQVAGEAFDRRWSEACRLAAPVTQPTPRQDLARRLGRFISAFHQTGRCHRDLYLCHVFVELDLEAQRPPNFALIDLARVHHPRWRRMRWLIKDLAQLDASARQIGATRTDRLRFLLAYLGLQPGAARLRFYAARIACKSGAILRRVSRKNAVRAAET